MSTGAMNASHCRGTESGLWRLPMTDAEKLQEARDMAWEIWTYRPQPRVTHWLAEHETVFERWRAEGWRPKEER